MLPKPAQGPEDFPTLDDYRREWICPCILGDLRTLMHALTTVSQLRGDRPYGFAKFVAAGTLFFACEHLGSLFVDTTAAVTNQHARFRAFFRRFWPHLNPPERQESPK